MPLRVFGYEGGNYRLQLTRKGAERYPVLTLVLYFGTERRWPEERTLFARLKVPDALRPFLNDCRVNVLEVAWITDEEASVFTSDFWFAVDYFRQIRQNGRYVGSARAIKHKDAVLKFLAVMTGSRRFEDAQIRLKNKEDVTMIDVLEEVENRGGLNMLFPLVDDGVLSPSVVAAKVNMSEDEFRTRMREQDKQDRQDGR